MKRKYGMLGVVMTLVVVCLTTACSKKEEPQATGTDISAWEKQYKARMAAEVRTDRMYVLETIRAGNRRADWDSTAILSFAGKVKRDNAYADLGTTEVELDKFVTEERITILGQNVYAALNPRTFPWLGQCREQNYLGNIDGLEMEAKAAGFHLKRLVDGAQGSTAASVVPYDIPETAFADFRKKFHVQCSDMYLSGLVEYPAERPRQVPGPNGTWVVPLSPKGFADGVTEELKAAGIVTAPSEKSPATLARLVRLAYLRRGFNELGHLRAMDWKDYPSPIGQEKYLRELLAQGGFTLADVGTNEAEMKKLLRDNPMGI